MPPEESSNASTAQVVDKDEGVNFLNTTNFPILDGVIIAVISCLIVGLLKILLKPITKDSDKRKEFNICVKELRPRLETCIQNRISPPVRKDFDEIFSKMGLIERFWFNQRFKKYKKYTYDDYYRPKDHTKLTPYYRDPDRAAIGINLLLKSLKLK